MSLLSVATTSALPSSQSIPSSHPAVRKILQRLSRSSLLTLTLDWLDDRNLDNAEPYLAEAEEEDDEQDPYPPAQSIPALRELYTELQAGKGSKRDVVDRVLEGDWRDGITLYQLAMADMQYLYDHPLSQKWTALKVVRLAEDSTSTKPATIPRFHPSTFLRNLQRETLPDVKAHYNFNRHTSLPITLLRIFVTESPYNTSAALQQEKISFDSTKTFYIAFPDASPYVYVSLTPSITTAGQSSKSESLSLRKSILDGIPKAFSKPRERYKLQPTTLSAKSLEALLDRRGPHGTNAAGGGWSVYTDDKKGKIDTPLDHQLPTPESSVEEDDGGLKKAPSGLKRVLRDDDRIVKRRKMIAKGRFGNSGITNDGKGIDRLDVRIEDPFPSISQLSDEDMDDLSLEPSQPQPKGRRSTIAFERFDDDEPSSEEWRPDIRFTFHGSHVHAGIRELVEAGIIDGERMPGWMTGEEGVSIGTVRDGRIRGRKGTGL